jgi:hypothetical protein
MGQMNTGKRTTDQELDQALAKAIRQLITVAVESGATDESDQAHATA